MMRQFFISLVIVCGLTLGVLGSIEVPKAEAVSMDQIKQQVKQAAEQRQEHEELGTNPSPGLKAGSKTTTKNQAKQTQKKPHVVERKVLGSWWNGKIVLESRDGLWVLAIT
jgi:hypothetical protein